MRRPRFGDGWRDGSAKIAAVAFRPVEGARFAGRAATDLPPQTPVPAARAVLSGEKAHQAQSGRALVWSAPGALTTRPYAPVHVRAAGAGPTASSHLVAGGSAPDLERAFLPAKHHPEQRAGETKACEEQRHRWSMRRGSAFSATCVAPNPAAGDHPEPTVSAQVTGRQQIAAPCSPADSEDQQVNIATCWVKAVLLGSMAGSKSASFR